MLWIATVSHIDTVTLFKSEYFRGRSSFFTTSFVRGVQLHFAFAV